MAKLTEDQVRLIRRLYAAGGHTHDQLAARFAVNRTTISTIVSRKLWAHLSEMSEAELAASLISDLTVKRQ